MLLVTFMMGTLIYRSLKSKYSETSWLTLTINTDGVNVFKSKRKASLWPLQMIINELPTNIRFKSKNTILCGIWFGADPNMKVFFRPFINEIQSLNENNLMYNGKTIIIRPNIATMDSLARCKVLAFNQFNGKFGCTY